MFDSVCSFWHVPPLLHSWLLCRAPQQCTKENSITSHRIGRIGTSNPWGLMVSNSWNQLISCESFSFLMLAACLCIGTSGVWVHITWIAEQKASLCMSSSLLKLTQAYSSLLKLTQATTASKWFVTWSCNQWLSLQDVWNRPQQLQLLHPWRLVPLWFLNSSTSNKNKNIASMSFKCIGRWHMSSACFIS